MIVLIANIIELFGQCTSLYGSTRKSKNEILTCQLILFGADAVSSYLLKGYSAIVTDVIGMLRNLLSIRNIGNKMISYVLLIATAVFGLWFNSNGFVGVLLVVVGLIQTAVILNRKSSTRDIQMACCFSSVCWAVFGLAIRNYVSAGFNVFATVSYLKNILSAKNENN